MSKKVKNKKNQPSYEGSRLESYDIPLFEQVHTLIPTIKSPLLRERAAAYIKSVEVLADEMSRRQKMIANDEPHIEKLKELLELYGKNSRVLDLILAVAISSGYLPMNDKVTAQKIRLSVQNKLSAYVQRQDKGSVIFQDSSRLLRVETHSTFGRRLAGLFSRFIRPTTLDEAQGTLLRESFLPEPAHDQIKTELAEARTHFKAGRLIEAEQSCKRILKTDRKNGEAIYYLGAVYLEAGNFESAIMYLQEAKLIYPDNAELLAKLGSAFNEMGLYKEAAEAYQESLRLDPDKINSLVAAAISCVLVGREGDAKLALDRALSLAPNSADVLAGLGVYFQMQGESEKAAIYYTRAIKIDPKHVGALSNLGLLPSWRDKTDQSINLINRALLIKPDHIDFLYTKSLLELSRGNYLEGWALYEHGLKSPKFRLIVDREVPHQPTWKGEVDHDKKLLIITEQGLGDSLQFVRYAALCKERVGKVFILCPPPLARLFENCPYIDEVYTTTTRLKHDEQVFMMSLPHVLSTTLETIPSHVPYLFVPPQEKEKWATRMSEGNGKRKIGLVWSSGKLHRDILAKRRNIELEKLLPLFDAKDVIFYNLQMDEEAKQIDALGLRDRLVDYMGDVKDMLDTAAIIENLDLVITVDTSVAHLAGALGKPVWIMLRYDSCWRWLKNRPDSPWYPTARLFGQSKLGEWGPVVQNICEALKDL